MNHKHNFFEVIKSLRKKHDIKIFEHQNKIILLRNFIVTKEALIIHNPHKKFDLGNKSYGKIDFLVNHCGFHIFFLKSFEN
jgi:hypothetical protein